MTTQSEPIVPIKLIGEECLRRVSQPVSDITDPEFISERERLALALEQFRAAKGFGRAIAAPQIGVNKRFISVNLGHGNRFTVINPRIIWSSSETFTLWDDCLSFPDLMVRVRRHESISVEFTSQHGEHVVMNKLDRAVSELLQHEIDHLDGILAVDRAIDDSAIVQRLDYEQHRATYDALVDYTIQPTIGPARE